MFGRLNGIYFMALNIASFKKVTGQNTLVNCFCFFFLVLMDNGDTRRRVCLCCGPTMGTCGDNARERDLKLRKFEEPLDVSLTFQHSALCPNQTCPFSSTFFLFDTTIISGILQVFSHKVSNARNSISHFLLSTYLTDSRNACRSLAIP